MYGKGITIILSILTIKCAEKMSNIEIHRTCVTVSVQESMTERDIIIIIILYNIV